MPPNTTDQIAPVEDFSSGPGRQPAEISQKGGILDRLRRKWRSLVAAALVLIGGAVAAGVSGSITDATRWLANRSMEVARDAFPPSLPRADPAAPLSILVARLDGDDDGSQSERINSSLGDAFRPDGKNRQVEVLYTRQTLKQGDSGNLAADLRTAEARGRSWLKQSGADVLIWGRVAEKNKVFRIYFLNQYATAQISNPHGTYSITPQLLLPTDFDRDLGVAIASVATSIAAPARQVGASTVDVLEALYPRLQRLAELTPSKNGRAYCDVKVAAAQLAAAIGSAKADVGRLRESVDALQAVVTADICSDDKDFAFIARIFLGASQVSLGNLEGDTGRLHAAIATITRALDGVDPARAPYYWATAKVGLSYALTMLGQREGNIAQLQDAVTASRDGVNVLVRERDGQLWASAQGSLGHALMQAAFVTGDMDQFNKSVQAFQDVLTVTKREDAPALWAMAKVGIGMALIAQAADAASLKDGVTAIRAGASEFTLQQVPYQWALAHGILGGALFQMYQSDNDVNNLRDAVGAFQDSLSVLTLARNPREWNWVQGELGQSLLYLAGRQDGVPILRQAIDHLQQALTGPSIDPIPLHALSRAKTHWLLGNALLRLGEWEIGTDRLKEATSAFQNALQMLDRNERPLEWAYAKRDLGRALHILGERENDHSRLRASIDAYNDALMEITPKIDPLAWANTQGDLAITLMEAGDNDKGIPLLRESITVIREKLSESSSAADPLQWAEIQADLGEGLLKLAGQDTTTTTLQQAIEALRACLTQWTKVSAPLDWPIAQVEYGDALFQLGERRIDVESVQVAVTTYGELLGMPENSRYRESARSGLTKAEAWLSNRNKNPKKAH